MAKMKLFSWLSDYYYMIKGGAAMFVLMDPPAHYLGHVVEGKCPIVVLPGILGRWSFIRPVANALSKAGHPVYVVPKLRGNLYEINISAHIVHEMIDKQNIKDAIIVAHSKGGLIGKYFMTHFNRSGHVDGMVTIATPFSGSSMAKFVPHNAFLELLPDNYIIRDLKKKTKVNDRIISIYPEYDNHVWHEEGSFLQGAHQNIMVDVHGHHKLIYNKKVIKMVVKAVNELSKAKKKK